MKRLFGLLIIAILLPETTGNSQVVETRVSPTTAPAAVNLAFPVQATSSSPLAIVYGGQNEDWQEWSAAMKELRDADSEAGKTDAKNNLKKLLTAQYDESLDSYDKYLEELSSKIADMKKQVEKRRAARDEMVELKLLMVVSEAEGLGWPDNRPGFGLPPLPMGGRVWRQGGEAGPGMLFGDDNPPGLFDDEVPAPLPPSAEAQPARPPGVR